MTIDAAIAAFADDFAGEDDLLLAVRDASDEYGVQPLSVATCGVVGLLARASRARTVAEVGTGVGVSGIYLLRNMDPSGILTTIDMEPEHHKVARGVFAQAGFGPERSRLITGRALDVLPRLTDAGYDMVLIDARRAESAQYLEHALRMTRPGGMVVLAHALAKGKVADPAQRDPETTAAREALKLVRGREDLTSSLLTVGDGLLVVSVPVGAA